MSHDEVVFIKWDIEMEGAQRGGLSIFVMAKSGPEKHITNFEEGSQKGPLEQACKREIGKESGGKRRERREIYRIFSKVLRFVKNKVHSIVNIFRIDGNGKEWSRNWKTINKLSPSDKTLRHISPGVPSENPTPPNLPTDDILRTVDPVVGHHQEPNNPLPKSVSPHTLCHHLSTICTHIAKYKQWSIPLWIHDQCIDPELASNKNDQVVVSIGLARLGQDRSNLRRFGDRIRRRKGVRIGRAIWKDRIMMNRDRINDGRRDIRPISCPADEITSQDPRI
jgi:hypothetical protein